MEHAMKSLQTLAVLNVLWLVLGVPLSVKEDAQNGTLIGTLTCINHANTTLVLLDNNGWFDLRKNARNTWDLLVGEKFDTIQNDSVVLHYRCEKDGKASEVTVILVAVNKHPPEFCNNSSFVLNIPENTAVGTNLSIFRICDGDWRHVDFHQYSVQPGSHLSLLQDGDNLKLLLNNSYDYDKMTTHILTYTVTVRDLNADSSIKSSSLTFKVNVTDVDDLSPAFKHPLYNCDIPEGTQTSRTICVVTAEDQDKGLNTPVNYSVVSVVPSTNIFTLDSTGEIQASGFLDRENISTYSLVIKGFQQDRPDDRYSFATVMIDITDIDDHPPVMSSLKYSKSIMENTENGVAVLQVAATDPDLGDKGKFSFVMTDPYQAFRINSSNGVISVRNSSLLDYEILKTNPFNLLVCAVPLNPKQRNSTLATVKIFLLDENDVSPEFENQSYSFHIFKNQSVLSDIDKITAQDPDTGTNLSYHLVSQTEAVPFSIDSQTGTLRVSGSLVENYKPVYILTVMTEDGPHSLATTRRSTARVTVYVKDVNMFWPKFEQGIDGLVLNISEATSVDTNIFELRASDKDSSDILNYSIATGNTGDRFGLRNDQRQLYVKQNLDRETTPEYHLAVHVTDGPHTASANITIKITDENDCDPVFENLPYKFNVIEERPGGTLIGNVAAKDHDIGANAAVHYKLADGYMSDNFTINNVTGEIRTRGKIDRELMFTPSDVIELVVIAADAGSPPRDTSARVSVTVQDTNDNKPVLKESIVNITRPEGFGPGVIYQIQAVDSDIGNNTEMSYGYLSAVSTFPANNVTILPDGKINITAPLQIDHQNVFHLKVNVKNKIKYSHGVGGPVRQDIYLTIQDVNNHVPEFTDKNLNVPLPEDYPTGKVFQRVEATDGDFASEFNTVTYWIDSAADHFGIDSATGDLYLTKKLDCENQTIHTLQVYASDMHASSDSNTVVNVSILVTVSVSDVNDCTPEFINGPYNCSVYENVRGRLNDCTVQAKDGDKTEANNQIHFMLKNSKLFNITDRGELSLTESLDYENTSIPHTFTLQVIAIDNGSPALSALTTVTVQLLNENDNEPKFDSATYHIDVPENNTPPSLLRVIQTTDDDGDKLIHSCYNKDFTFVDGFLKVTTILDYESETSVNFTISASDGRNSTTAEVYVNVVPVNEFPPVIHWSDVDIDVTENTNVTFQFNVTDVDHGEDGRTSLMAEVADRWKPHIVCDKEPVSSLATCSILDLDRERTESVEVLLVASDQGSPPRTAAVSKTVKVTGVNDNAPYFLVHVQNVTVTEGVAKDNLYTAHAKDGDVGTGSVIRYRLKSPHSSLFNISADGRVSAGALNIDNINNGSYILEIEAFNIELYENCSSCVNGNQTLIVFIQDVNNHSPRFLNSSCSKNIPEDTPPGTLITRVIAKDNDFTEEYNTVSYSIQPPHDNFHIDTSRGDIYLTNNLDYENKTQRTFTLMVYASDMKPDLKTNKIVNANLTVIVTVSDVNDNFPEFITGPYSCSVMEEYSGEIENCSVKAEDKDSGANGIVTYSVTNQIFTVNKNGQLSLNRSLDFDKAGSQHVYRIQVKASDRGMPPHTALTSVTIHLLNKNDNKPVFNQPSYNFSMQENNTICQLLQPGRIIATDADGDSLNYIVSDPDFRLNDGFLQVATVLDYETITMHIFNVTVFDGNTPVSATVTVHVLPLNEFAPVFDMMKLRGTQITVKEGTKRKNICVDAKDHDRGVDGKLNYTREIYPEKWNMFVTSTAQPICSLELCRIDNLDRDIDESGQFILTFKVQDQGIPPKSSEVTVTVKVTGVNDNPPQFERSSATYTLHEGIAKHSLHTAVATDADKGVGSTIFYRLKDGNSSLFHVVDNGSVSTEPLWIDETNHGVYMFTIEAYNTEPFENCKICRNGAQNVTVILQDVNNYAPVFEKPLYDLNLNECLLMGSNISRVSAIDKDATLRYNTVTYWLGDNYSKTFRIDSHTGDIYLDKPIDYDPPSHQNNFSLVVYASDIDNQTANTTVEITVENCNDNPPKFDQATYRCSAKENATETLHCTHPVRATDVEDGSKVTYRIVTGPDTPFEIDSKSGVIRVKQKLDYERLKHEFSITVTANDHGVPPLESNCTVIVQLENINDWSPEFLNVPYIFSVYENTLANVSSIGEIAVRDRDGDHVTVTIQGGNSDFRLSDNLELFPLRSFDFENHAERTLQLTVLASDFVHTTTASVTVHVQDRNDVAPKFLNESYSSSVLENVNISYSVVQVKAKDSDSAINGNNVVTYSILEGGEGMFQIDSTTGWITTVKKLNASVRETYALVVQATDNGIPHLVNITTVTVHIDDVNDLAPWFLYTPYTATVRENENASIIMVYGKDPDPSTTTLKFDIVDKALGGDFHFEKNTLYATNLDAETLGPHVDINISLTDDDNAHTVYETVYVTVIDVNDHDPYFNNTPYNATIPDTAQAGTDVLSVTAGDKDKTNNNVTYILYGGHGNYFIDRKTGLITISDHADFNYARMSVYNMTVLVQDSGSPPRTNSAVVTVRLTETNAGPPKFTKTQYTFTFPENNQSVSDKVVATDVDGVIYSIISREDNNRFSVDSTTGVFTLASGDLDFENKSEYSLIIQAKDKAAFPKSSAAKVTINVEDKNEAPKIIINPKNVFKEINSTQGEEVMIIDGNDPDTKPEFRNLTYSLKEDGTNYFKIDPESGSITVRSRLDHAGNFSLKVTVTDAGGLKDDGLVFVFVSNITGHSLNTSVYENQTVGTLVYDLKDARKAINLSELTLEIQKDTDSGKFKLKDNTTIVTNAVLDRETAPEFGYDLIINGKDTVNKIMKAQIQLHVRVLDVNDKSPKFTNELYNFHVKEEEKVGTVINNVTATDVDLNPNLTYYIVNGSDYFNISDTGTITVRKKIDRESLNRTWNDIIQLQVSCFDGNFTATADVRITILDVNDHPPEFTKKKYFKALYENHTLGVLPETKIAATDRDTVNQGKLNYSISDGNIGDHFSMGLRTGNLSLVKALDYENRTDFSLIIMVEDGIFNATATVHINVIDVNDNDPKFQLPSYSFYVPEGASSLRKRFNVTATDLDSGNNSLLSYSFLEDDAKRIGSYFRIYTDNKEGVLEVMSELDRDGSLLPHENLTGNAFYTFTVVAKDHGQPQKLATAKVTIYVTDINDCPPKFTKTNITREVQESSLPGYHILTLTTSDCDYYSNYTTVLYELHGKGSDHFNISKSGEITLNKPVSLQESGCFNLVVSAYDGKNAANVRPCEPRHDKTNNASLRINVIDTNDHAPDFGNSSFSFDVSENSAPGIVAYVSATDEDLGKNGQVTYRITSGDGKDLFDIDPENGTILLKGHLDREQKDSYTLFITATDHAQKDKTRSANCEVMISVLDENDKSPVFHPSNIYSAAIREDSPNGTVLIVMPKINATDDDYGDKGTAGIRYSLAGDGSHFFCIDQLTAMVELCRAPLDRETDPYYQLQIIASDRIGNSAGHNASASLNITVIDANDNIPQFTRNYLYSVSENTNTTTSVGHVSVTDDDLSGSNKIRYAIRSGGKGQFYIDPVTGSIHVSGSLDRERQDMYYLNVTVTDGRADHVNWTIVKITVQDVNDCPPEFYESVLDVGVYEGQGPADIMTEQAYDRDENNTENSRISFFLKNDAETDSLFNISEHGVLSTLQPLDRENKSSYILTVMATDHGDPQLSSSQAVRVAVLDINDHTPVFCNENDCSVDVKEKHSSIVEESPQDSVVAVLVAKDADKGNNGTVIYSIEGDPRATQFIKINKNTGLVKLAQSVNLNRLVDLGLLPKNETENASLEVTVVATDQGMPKPKSTSLMLVVSIMGINDQAPEFKLPVFSFNVSEDFKVGDIIGETGAMVNSSSLHLTYAKVSRIGNENFDILERSGEIRLSKSLDRETESYYTFPILVRDGGIPERTAYAAVEIHVLDCNDNNPQFLEDHYVFNIPENTTWTGVMNISATDRDVGFNAALVYSLLNDFGGLLSIDNSSGLVAIHRVLDREDNKTIVYTVLVKDSGSSSLGSNTSVTIHVLDLNDNAPVFYNSPSIVRMMENNISQSFQVHATDPDEGLNGTVIFELDSQDTGPFQINPFTGKVTLLEPLDYELVPGYNLTILASDQGQLDQQRTSHNVTVRVIDEYDLVPQCEPKVTEMTIKSSVPVSTEIAQVHAGKGNLSYTLTGGPSEFFFVDEVNGRITTRIYLGRQTNQHVLSVTATDLINHKTATCKVIVHIEDSSSSFSMPFYNVSISENLNVTLEPYLLIDLNTTEKLGGGHVTYTIARTDPKVTSKFWVDPASGRVYCNASLDREEQGIYQLYITAHSAQIRRKRDPQESSELGTIKLTVVVRDVNDCPPRFTDNQGQNQLFGVPTTAKANYLVTTLKTSDEDEAVNSKTLYRVIDGDTAVFGVDQESGELRTLAAVAKSKKKQFKLTVMAIDHSEPTLNDTISLKIYAVDPSEQLMLTVNMSITDFTKKSEDLISKMGDILGVNIQLEYSTPHKQPDSSVDLKTIDIFFHGLNTTTNSIIPYDKMLDLMIRNEAKLKELFNMQLLEVEKVPVDHYIDPSKITVSQIALICMAVLIFFGSLLGIVLTMYSRQRLEEAEKSETKVREKNLYSEIELESLRRRHSNRPDVSAAFVNQAYAETELSSQMSKQKKKGVQYESQELRMTFNEEMQGGIVLHNGPVHRDNNGSFSMADSGVENSSLHSSDQNRPASSSGHTEDRGKRGDKNVSGVVTGTSDERKGTSRVLREPVSTVEAPSLKFLHVDEAPMMTSTPYQSHTDISSPGTTGVILDRERSGSETESTTDILDVDKTIPDTSSHEYENVDVQDVRVEGNKANIAEKDATQELTMEFKDSIKGKGQQAVKGDQVDVGAAGDRSCGSTLEEGDGNLSKRDRTLTLSFEEIGETNDEDETTQF